MHAGYGLGHIGTSGMEFIGDKKKSVPIPHSEAKLHDISQQRRLRKKLNFGMSFGRVVV